MAITLAVSFLVLLLAFPPAYGTDYTVGDSTGWSLAGDYSTWVNGKTFNVGDNLVFKYDSTHGLDIVDENGYQGCSSSNALKSYQDGNTKVALSSPGKMYFICPTAGHCSGGMKLSINVVAASTTPSGSPPTTPSGTPPTTPSKPSPSPSSESGTPATTTTSPPPPPNGAVSVSIGISHLMGSLFVSAIMLAFMG